MYNEEKKIEEFAIPNFPVRSAIPNKTQSTNIIVIPHLHSYLEVMKIIKGPVNVKIGLNHYICNNGDIIFVPSETIHEVTAETYDKQLVGLVFDPESFNLPFTNYNYNVILNNNKIFNYIFPPEHEYYENINKHFTRAIVHYHNKNDTYKLEISAHILLLLSALLKFYVPDLQKTSNDMFYKIQPALDYIDKHYSEKIYISTLSSILNVCDDHFIRMFKKAMHQTPNQFIVNVRIQKAMILLSSTEMSISQISEKTGFSSYAHFCNTFTAKNDVTPRIYRQKCKQVPPETA